MSWSSEHQSNSWVTEEPALKSTPSESFVSLWAYCRLGLQPYHPQNNGQLEWAHQTLICMIGKLHKDQKTEWLKHVPELVHAYNSMGSAITRYSPHYLIFRCQPHLPIDFYFSMIRGIKKHQCVDHYIAKLHDWLWETLKEAQMQSTSEAERQKWHYDRKANAILLEPGDLVLAKANTYRGRRKVKGWWELYKVECQVAEGIPSYLVKNQQTGCSWVLHWNQLFLIILPEGTHLCMLCRPSGQGALPPP